MKITYKNLKGIILLSLVCWLMMSCNKAVEVQPPVTGLVNTTVFANNNTATAALTGIYINMANTGLSDGGGSLSYCLSMSADELNFFGTDPLLGQFYQNTLGSNSRIPYWTEIYSQIYRANAAIEGLTSSKTLNENLKRQLLGEAKFVRAFYSFYAANLYGDVPLVLTTDYRINNTISRSPKSKIYEQAIIDLTEAQDLLSTDYRNPDGSTTTNKIRPNKAVATALLARVYLYNKDWANAEIQSTALISNPAYKLVGDLNKVFLINSDEAIWQLQSTNISDATNTVDAYLFVLTSTPGTNGANVAITDNLLNAFETNDPRRANWIGKFMDGTHTYNYPFKYKIYLRDQPVSEYTMVFRLAEQYLIRAEARAQKNDLNGAISDLNLVRTRARGTAASAVVPNLSSTLSQTAVIAAVAHERQVELFAEWGHRWFDLKRTEQIDVVMNLAATVKGSSWDPNWALFPISQTEIRNNPNLKQTPGY